MSKVGIAEAKKSYPGLHAYSPSAFCCVGKAVLIQAGEFVVAIDNDTDVTRLEQALQMWRRTKSGVMSVASGDILMSVTKKSPPITVRLDYDDSCENPMDCDGQWTLYSFSKRHQSHADPETLGLSLQLDKDGLPKVSSPGLRSKLKVGLAFFLSYYEHGLCLWSLLDRGPHCDFDSVRVAGLLV